MFLSIGITLAQDSGSISSNVVVRPRSISVEFWTPERMKAAKEPVVVLPTKNINTGRSMSILTGPQLTVPGQSPDVDSPLSRVLNTLGRQVATTGRVFWSCNNVLSCCSGSVI
ncbi:unnamed protein product, partial [Adineta steineri]